MIHTVGPVWQGGRSGEADLLASCYRNCLRLAVEHDVSTIAFPAISCGVYGYPILEATRIAVRETRAALRSGGRSVMSVQFVCFGDEVWDAYQAVLAEAT